MTCLLPATSLFSPLVGPSPRQKPLPEANVRPPILDHAYWGEDLLNRLWRARTRTEKEYNQ